jgi:hypothetical protein
MEWPDLRDVWLSKLCAYAGNTSCVLLCVWWDLCG